MSHQFWDERYRGPEYAYGREPNDFLRDEAQRIPRGRVLCLAEGEGRNAVWLARRGYEVTAVDFSVEGLRKAAALAQEQGVRVELVHADLATWVPPRGGWSGVVSIFAHVPPSVRRRVHGLVAELLAPGGVLVLEAYTPAQLAFGTGGPKDPSLLVSLADLRGELAFLDLVVAREVEREIHEGRYHGGRSSTVQAVGVMRERALRRTS